MCFGVAGIYEFDADFVDFVLELARPVEIIAVGLYKQDFAFEDTHGVDTFAIVILQVDDLVVEILIVLMPLDDADALLALLALPQKPHSFLLYALFHLAHVRSFAD